MGGRGVAMRLPTCHPCSPRILDRFRKLHVFATKVCVFVPEFSLDHRGLEFSRVAEGTEALEPIREGLPVPMQQDESRNNPDPQTFAFLYEGVHVCGKIATRFQTKLPRAAVDPKYANFGERVIAQMTAPHHLEKCKRP